MTPKIPGFDVLDKIGEGGSSEVFLAIRQDNRQRTALKLLHERYSGDQAMRRRLEREAEVIGKLQHPNLVNIYKWGVLDERFFMVLEYLGKGSLSEFGDLDMRRRLKTMLQICDGVKFIHRQQIVHRDLKPSNIMFGDDGIPRLVDFGISLFSQAEFTRLTHTNMVMGTLAYMSPEQQTSPGDVDERSDIYALGAILYEIFTGRKPVGRFADPSQLDQHFNPMLEGCILKCLAHNPDDRYQSVDVLERQLVTLWHDGLFAAEGESLRPFDERIGYWIVKLSNGTPGERHHAKERILVNAVPEDVDELINIGRNSGAEVRAAVIPTLAKLGDRKAFDFIVDQLANPHLTREACVALGELGDVRAVEPLIRIIKKGESFAHNALVPLAKLCDEKQLKYVAGYLKSKNFADRQEAVKAFEQARIKPRKHLSALKKQYGQETDNDLRSRLYTMIQRLENA